MKFQDIDFAEDYEKRLTQESYPGDLFDTIRKELKGCKTVIDIGAGTGFFSIPLAGAGYTVFAVEPSRAMAQILQRKCIEKNLKIDLSVMPWEDWEGEHKDAAISIHSVYGFSNLETSVLKMTDSSSKRLILVKTGKSETFTEAVRRSLNISVEDKKFGDSIAAILKKNNLKFEVRELTQRRDYFCKEIGVEAEWFKKHYSFENKSIKSIEKAIESCTLLKNGKRIYNSVYCDLLFVW